MIGPDLNMWKLEISLETLTDELRQAIPPLLQRFEIPGLSLALIRDAGISWVEGFGVKSLATGQAVSTDTVFEAASLSKPVTALAALKMCEAGLLDLDTPLVTYLPEPYYPDDGNTGRMTARHVLTHTSGFPNGLPDLIPRMKERRFLGDSERRITYFEPGARFAYSGEGFYFLQLVMAHVSGMTFDQLMRSMVLEPMAMPTSDFVWREEYEWSMADRHDEEGRPASGKNWAAARAYPVACASLSTTPSEYARFMCALLQATEVDNGLLQVGTVNRMLCTEIMLNDSVGWALGWGKQHYPDGTESFWHHGRGLFSTFAIGFPTQRTGLVAMANGADDEKAEEVFRTIVEMAFGGPHPAFDFIAGDTMTERGYIINH